MIFCFLLSLSSLFFKSSNFNFFEGLNSNMSNLLININTSFEIFNNLFYMDNVSNLFIILTTLLTPFALLTNFNSIIIFNSKKLFFSLLLYIELMLIITFSTGDLFIFYLGFEGLSIPVFFLIYLYGTEITKIRASLYFIIYSFLSASCMSISIFLLYSKFSTSNIHQLIIKYKASISSIHKVNSEFILYNKHMGSLELYKEIMGYIPVKPIIMSIHAISNVSISLERLSLI